MKGPDLEEIAYKQSQLVKLYINQILFVYGKTPELDTFLIPTLTQPGGVEHLPPLDSMDTSQNTKVRSSKMTSVRPRPLCHNRPADPGFRLAVSRVYLMTRQPTAMMSVVWWCTCGAGRVDVESSALDVDVAPKVRGQRLI